MNRILVVFLVAELYSPLIFAQDQASMVTINGRITYLTADMVYTDIGSEHGAAVGDTLSIFRRNEEIGLVVITNLSSKHSVCKSLVPSENFQLGDNLKITKLQTELPDDGRAEIVDEGPEKREAVPRIRKLTHRGRISLRSSHLGSSGNTGNSSRTISTVQYRFNLASPIKLQAWVYARSDLSDPGITIYQARLTLGQNQDTYQVAVGRIYSYEFAPVGATDGLLLSRNLTSNFSIGTLLGFQPEPSSLSFDKDRKKFGFYASFAPLKRKFLLTTAKFSGSVAYVSENYKGETDREFLYLKMNSSFGRKVDLRYSQTIDFDRNNSVSTRGNAELTALHLSVAVRPTGRLSINSRITTRKQIRYLTSQPVTPDSLFFDAVRTGIYNTVRINTGRFGYFQLGSNFRTETNSRKNSYIYFLDYRNDMTNHKSITVGFSYLNNLIATAIKVRFGYQSPLFFNLTSYSWIEIYRYSFGGRGINNNRFTLSESIDWRVGSGYYLSLLGEYYSDRDFDQVYFLFQASYRF